MYVHSIAKAKRPVIFLNKRAKIALYRSPDYQSRFESVGLLVQEKEFNIGFQDGEHLGFPIRTSLAIFYLQVTSILRLKFRVNWPFCSKEKVQNRFSI